MTNSIYAWDKQFIAAMKKKGLKIDSYPPSDLDYGLSWKEESEMLEKIKNENMEERDFFFDKIMPIINWRIKYWKMFIPAEYHDDLENEAYFTALKFVKNAAENRAERDEPHHGKGELPMYISECVMGGCASFVAKTLRNKQENVQYILNGKLPERMRNGKITEEEKEEIVSYLEKGTYIDKIALYMGISRSSVIKVRKDIMQDGKATFNKKKYDLKNEMPNITDKDVETIMEIMDLIKAKKTENHCLICSRRKTYKAKFSEDGICIDCHKEKYKKCKFEKCESEPFSNKKYCFSHYKKMSRRKKYKKKDTKKRIKTIKGKMIFNEINNNPVIENKSLWDGIGLWSKKYDFCVECNKNMYKYIAKGLCAYCYRRQFYKKSTIKLGKNKKLFEKKYKERRNTKKKKYLDILKDAEDGNIDQTPRIRRILQIDENGNLPRLITNLSLEELEERLAEEKERIKNIT